MIRTMALRALPAVAVTGAPALPLVQGAQAAAAVGHPGQVRRGDTDFMHSHPRVEVRYGNLGPPDWARVVASAATLM
ncbi:hypothetical protein GTW98_16255 [Streptomyces sp. SID8375]|uniref:hypothetical protein n=2 Tax=Streptomyces TaxID=1883 RepID=UPI00037FDEFE|nr:MULTISPECIES: hypothetical protein [unclassified Streptomyces]MYX08334.1 hypothetical protein [Streptomyces sp. SID8375]